MENPRKLKDIAKDIRADWKNIYFGAVPYLEAMEELDYITDRYYLDDAESIVLYFLSNARFWRGEKAKEIKFELNQIFIQNK